MGIWIIVGVQVVLSLATFVAIVLTLAWARAGAKDGREARKLVEALAAAFRKGHENGCAAEAAPASPSPSPVEVGEPSPALARSAVEVALPAETSPPKSGRRLTPEPPSPAPVTRPSTAPGDARAARTSSSRPPPPVVVAPLRALHDDPTFASAEDAPTSADFRAAFHREADERDERHGVPPPAPVGDVAARFAHVRLAPAPGDEDMTLRRTPSALPSAEPDDGERVTGEEHTKVWSTKRPPPHGPPRPIKSARPTMLGGLAGARLERPTSDPKRAAADFAARAAEAEAKRDRDTLTPTDPSLPPLDRKIARRFAELVAGAQAEGEDTTHCHGPRCFQGGAILCECHCDSCALAERLLAQAQQEILGKDW